MIAAALAIVLGALAFESGEVPDIRITGVQALSGRATTNFDHADLDGDGAVDILLNDWVLLQRDGRFPQTSRYALPEPDAPALIQAWAGDLFLWSAQGLARYRFSSGVWETVTIQDLPQTDSALLPSAEPLRRRQPFLHDLDSDGTPELVHITQQGAQVFVNRGEGYEETPLLDILPSMQLSDRALSPIWPHSARQLSFPVLKMACRLVIEGGTFSVISRETADSSDLIRYRRTDFVWDAEMSRTANSQVTEPLARHLHPCRLNADSQLDLAGGRWEPADTAVLPMPVYETWASLDGGQTLQIRRSATLPGLRPRCSFTDFYDDGSLAMITEETGFFDGGLRETISRVLTLSELRHRVNVFRQRAGAFDARPTLRKSFTIQLELPAVREGAMFQRYSAGQLVDVTGDFDGDGIHEIVVRDRIDRISVYHAADKGMGSTAWAELSLGRLADFGVADINGDGRSDILVWEEGHTNLVHFSREQGL